jgi:hypothetical protein
VLVTFNDPLIRVAGTNDIHINTAFASDPTTAVSSLLFTPNVSAGLQEGVGLGLPVTAVGSGSIYDILVGTFTFTADNAPGHSIIITAMRTADNSQDNIGADFPPTVLDDPIAKNGPFSATITELSGGGGAAPEPSTVVLMTFTSLGLALAYGWRRLKRI